MMIIYLAKILFSLLKYNEAAKKYMLTADLLR